MESPKQLPFHNKCFIETLWCKALSFTCDEDPDPRTAKRDEGNDMQERLMCIPSYSILECDAFFMNSAECAGMGFIFKIDRAIFLKLATHTELCI